MHPPLRLLPTLQPFCPSSGGLEGESLFSLLLGPANGGGNFFKAVRPDGDKLYLHPGL